MVHVKPNANFYSLSGTAIREDQGGEYKEYRRCWIDYPSKFILRDFPMHLDVEITSRCNIRCTFCDKLSLLTNGQLGDMSMEMYKRIIDEASERKVWGLKLSYRGEPFLHKDVIEMIEYAKKKGILDVYFNTNGMLLDPNISERLIDAGLDRISVSIEGTDPVNFERRRIGARFDVIMKNVDNLMEIRRRKNADHPKVRIQTVRLPDLDMDAYKSFWVSHCDEVAAVDYKDERNRQKGFVYDWACPQLWQRMTIQWDGTVLPCNNDDFRMLSPGNVKEKTIYECWHYDNIEKVRSLHKRGLSHEVEACDGCPWRTAQIKKLQ